MTAIVQEVWGSGERVVLVHGSLATGPIEWQAQRPLAELGYQLVIPTRRAYAANSERAGEDFLTDGEDMATLLGNGAHVVGHSYGGIVAMVAAARRPQAVRSLVLAEPPVFDVAPDAPAVAQLRRGIEQSLQNAEDDRRFLEDFLSLVGSPIGEFPPEVIAELTSLVPAFRHGRQPWSADVPVKQLIGAPFPTLVVSGNHHEAFTEMCTALARDVGAQHLVVEGSGHEMQMADSFNALLLEFWRSASDLGTG